MFFKNHRITSTFCILFAFAILIPAELNAALRYTDLTPPVVPAPTVAGGGTFTAAAALGGIHTSQAAFQTAAGAAGFGQTFVETFEESNIGPGSIQGSLALPLAPGVPNTVSGIGFPTGLAATNIQMTVNPLDPAGLAVIGAGAVGIGNPTTVLGANDFAATTIIEVIPASGLPAIGFEVLDPIGGSPDFDLTVRDPLGAILFAGSVPAGTPGFIGVLGGTSMIGSIEVG